MRKSSLGAVAAAVIAAIAVQCPAYAADDDIVIGFAVAGSAGWTNAYRPCLEGEPEMAIADFNAKGGVLGEEIPGGRLGHEVRSDRRGEGRPVGDRRRRQFHGRVVRL